MRHMGVIEDGAVLARDGVILATGRTADIMRMPDARNAYVIDASGKVVLPAFVDSHTHLVFGAPRLTDFEMRSGGAPYQAIAQGTSLISNSSGFIHWPACWMPGPSAAPLKPRHRWTP